MSEEIKHTPEPWFCDNAGSIWRRQANELYQNGGGVAGDKPIAMVNKGWYGEDEIGYPVTANARRIVACVNACRGIHTKTLEQASTATHPAITSSYEQIIVTRDALLEALERIVIMHGNAIGEETFLHAKRAIASAKGSGE